MLAGRVVEIVFVTDARTRGQRVRRRCRRRRCGRYRCRRGRCRRRRERCHRRSGRCYRHCRRFFLCKASTLRNSIFDHLCNHGIANSGRKMQHHAMQQPVRRRGSAMSIPAGENAAEFTPTIWPAKVWVHAPVSMLQGLVVRS